MGFKGHQSIERISEGSGTGYWSHTCGHCGRDVSGIVFARYNYEPSGSSPQGTRGVNDKHNLWLCCPSCKCGSVVTNNVLFPSPSFGPAIAGLPEDTANAYDEARRCMTVSAFTSAELVCRKILMHVAVDKGAGEGKKFAFYIEYLADQGYVTPPMKPWVKLIKDHGNEATHELPATDRERAESTVMFTAELLRLVYEMEAMSKKFSEEPKPETNSSE